MPRELIASEPGKTAFRDYTDRPLVGDEIRIRTEFASPKHGTESHGFTANTPFEEEYFDPEYRMFLPRKERVKVFPKPVGNMAVGH